MPQATLETYRGERKPDRRISTEDLLEVLP